jgi:hypothetical protein
MLGGLCACCWAARFAPPKWVGSGWVRAEPLLACAIRTQSFKRKG